MNHGDGTHTHPAQVVFTESPSGGSWTGRLMNERDAFDTADSQNERLAYVARVVYDGPPDRYGTDRDILGYVKTGEIVYASGPDQPTYRIVTQGRQRGGRRYGSFATLTDAQQALAGWAGRRFRVRCV